MVLVIHSQGSVTEKITVRKVFLNQVKNVNSEEYLVILSTFYTNSRLFVWVWGVNENTLWWSSVSTSLVMTLRGLYLEPELSPAPFFPHDCKTLPTFGTMTQGCALEGEWCCVSGCALFRMLFHEQLGWGMQMKPAHGSPRQKPNPCHHLERLMCVTMWVRGVAFHA